MPSYSADQLSEWSEGHWADRKPASVKGFCIDSRVLQAGDCFVAIPTARRDGHEFLSDAAAKGAVAALVERPVEEVSLPQLVVPDTVVALQAMARGHRRNFKQPVVGVTGSCGKTSSKELLSVLLGGDAQVLSTHANLNNQLGVPLTLLRMDLRQHQFAIVEAGMNLPGEMDILGHMIEPNVALVTNVGPVHLEGVGSVQGVAREKAQLPTHARSNGWSAFPAACLQYEDFRALRKDCVVFHEGKQPPELPAANFQAVAIEVCEECANGADCSVGFRDSEGEWHHFRLPFMSHGMMSNAAMTLYIASRLGVGDAMLQARLQRWSPPPFRGQIVQLGQTVYYVDCYNSNPDSLLDTCDAFRRVFHDLPRLYVLGCMNELGAEADYWHTYVGSKIQLAETDHVLLIGRESEALEKGLRQAGNRPEQITLVDDLETAREAIERFSGQRGAALLKGSRSYHLELLLPDSWEQHTRMDIAVC